MADDSASTLLSIANGGITLENSRVAVATLDPMRALGSSAFGPLVFRTLVNGVAGDWQPLATLVRLPLLRDLKCPAAPELACKLSGSSLFLVDSVSNESDFTHAVQVPDGFPGYSLPVPHPENGVLYVRLRDDPSVVSRAMLSAQPLPPPTDESAGSHSNALAQSDRAAQPQPAAQPDAVPHSDPVAQSDRRAQPDPGAGQLERQAAVPVPVPAQK
jgi:hypothetical protein